MRTIRESVHIIADKLTRNTLLASTIGVVNIVVTNVTATAGEHLTILGVTGKDVLLKLTDASGARKFLIKDSADETVASIDSNGVITGSSIVGPLTGDSAGTHRGAVVGDINGVLSNHETGDTTGAPTNAELITAFGAVAEVANGIVGTFTDTHASGKTYIVINNGAAYTVVESTAAA